MSALPVAGHRPIVVRVDVAGKHSRLTICSESRDPGVAHPPGPAPEAPQSASVRRPASRRDQRVPVSMSSNSAAPASATREGLCSP